MGDRDEIERTFREYVFGFIFHDIEREIWLAKKAEHDKMHGRYPGPHPGGGNLIAALALLSYTEFLGSFVTGDRKKMRENFRAFLELMPACYVQFDDQLNTLTGELRGIYGMFRNGMAHEYAVKRGCDIYMLSGRESCGIGEENGRYFFVVERYFEDFSAAVRRLYAGTPKLPS